ncbi:MAG: PAS domain S-box protein [Phycisphaeraceae bacterium]
MAFSGRSDDALLVYELSPPEMQPRLVDLSEEAHRLLGYAREDLLDHPFEELTPDACHVADRLRALGPGEDLVNLATLIGRDRRPVPVWLYGERTTAEDDRARLGVHFRPLHERAGEETPAILAAIVGSSDDAIIGSSPDGVIISWNEGARQMFGYSGEEMLGRSLRVLMPGDRADEFEAIRERVQRGERVSPFETERITRDGQRLPVSVRVSPVLDEAGRVIGASTIDRDISERVKSRQRLESLLHTIPDLIFILDARGTYLEVHTGEPHLLVAPPEQLLGRTVHDVMPADVSEKLQGVIAHTLATGELQEIEHALEVAGETHWFAARVVPYKAAERPSVLWLSRDITDQKRAEDSLSRSEERFAKVFNAAPVAGIISRVSDARILEANKAWEQATGFSRADTLGLTCWEMGVLPSLAEQETLLERASGGAVYEQEVHYRHRSGEVRVALSSTDLVEFAGQRCLVTMFQDITELKRADAALRESEARFRAAFEQAAVGMAQVAPDGHFMRVNEKFTHIVGYSGAELEKLTYLELTHPDHREINEKMFLDLNRGEAGAYTYEKRYYRKDGSEVWVHVSASPVLSETGQVLYTLGVVEDITQRKEAEAALADSEARFRAAFGQAAVGIVMVEPGGHFTEVNDRFCEIVGRTAEELRQMTFLDLTHPEDRPANWQAFERSKRGELAYLNYEKRYLHADGHAVWVRVSSTPVLDDAGAPRFHLGVVEDITERKLAEQEVARHQAALVRRAEQLRALTAELTDAEQRERRRLAQILHDHLQQLLVAVKMRTAQLHGQVGEGPRGSVEQMDELLDQAIEASRTLTMELAPPVLYGAGLVAGLEWLGRWMEEKHGLKVHVEADEAAEPAGESLRAMLFSGVRELLFNVVKHAQTNEAWVTVTRTDEPGIRIVVEDEGAGFDPEAAASDTSGGGFGLFSLGERLEALHGSMELESSPGEGTRVTVLAPLNEAEPPTEPEQVAPPGPQAPAPEQGEHIRVVLADDHQVLREGLSNLLAKQQDIEVVGEAADGAAALSLARQLRPDVVVMDVAMPGMGGIEATRRLKREMPEVRVVALSFHEEPEIARQMRDAGAEEYLTKGGPADELISAIRMVHEVG